jgi:hypothetical protein
MFKMALSLLGTGPVWHRPIRGGDGDKKYPTG